MASTSNVFDRITALVPHQLAWPMSALSTIAAFGGALLVFIAAALGSITAGVWGGAAFLVAAITWHLADFAQSNRPG